MFQRIWSLILKELAAQFRDPKNLRLLILPVIIQLALFPFAATLEVKNNTLAVYNQDAGAHSVELIQRLAQAKAFTTLEILHNEDEIRDTIDNKKALFVVRFPPDFSRDIASGKPAKILAITDGRRSNAAQIALAYIQEIVGNYQEDLRLQTIHSPPSSELIVRNWFNPNLDYQWFILPSLIAMITTIGCLVVTAMSVAREREQGTFEQLLVSPLTPIYIMIGKIVPALMIALMQATIILTASVMVYQIPFQGSFVLLYVCLLCYGISLAGIGLFISSLCSTQQQAFLGVFCFMMPAVILSGFISPIENIPEPLQSITWLNPLRHFMVIARGIYLKGFDMSLVWPHLWPLLVIALITLSLAYVIFRRYAK